MNKQLKIIKIIKIIITTIPTIEIRRISVLNHYMILGSMISKRLAFQSFLILLLVSQVLGISYDACRAGDVLFIKPRESIEISVVSPEGGPELNETVDSSSESNCFSRCKNILRCKSATFFEAVVGTGGSPGGKCLLRDTNRFGVRNRAKRITSGKYFEKTDGCSAVARERRRVVAMVTQAFDCKDVLEKGWKHDGVYLIQHPGEETYRPIRCRMSILGGGWTSIQRRVDGALSFIGDWERYKKGFGEVSNEFWYGNENIHNLTSNGESEIIFELKDANGNLYYPYYDRFEVHPESDNYKVNIGAYEYKYGSPLPRHDFYEDSYLNGRDFILHNGMSFSTIDRDHDVLDGNCAVEFNGGWWFKNCVNVCLNSRNYGIDGINIAPKWYQITNTGTNTKSLRYTEMMVRRK